MAIHNIPWQSPIELAAALEANEEHFVFLYSSLLTKYSGRYSYIAYTPTKIITDLKNIDSFNITNRYFGYLGYEMLFDKSVAEHYINTPDIYMVQFSNLITFDHKEKTCTLTGVNTNLPTTQKILSSHTTVNTLESNMSKEDYCKNIEKTIQAITRGDFYQANITRKFYGTFATPPNAFEIFAQLSQRSPAPYSAFLKLGKYRIISSSPEMFIKLSADGTAENTLIKGTTRRFHNTQHDQSSKLKLQNSEKDQSENIMIVDLMRNDFTKGSYTDSIQVKNLYEIYSYKTVHHALSTIQSKKLPQVSSLEFIRNCFPAGSMTGAPKKQVMQWCSEIEKWKRGVYSGALGWLDGDGSLDLSVVIRTIIIEENRFEFQVGGGIVYESNPEDEWKETMDKSAGIAQALNINIERLKKI